MDKLTNDTIRSRITEYFENPDGSISTWDVSEVTDMNSLFSNRDTFDEPLYWNTANVTNMSRMFDQCYQFNQPLNWDVSKVEDMSYMFDHCFHFNSSLTNPKGGPWDVSSVKNMQYMFNGCSEFNQDIRMWDVSSVQNMNFMFSGCDAFDGDLSGWDVSSVTSYEEIFDTYRDNMPKFKSDDELDAQDEFVHETTQADWYVFGAPWRHPEDFFSRECIQLFSDYLKHQKMRYLEELCLDQHKADIQEMDNDIPWELGLNCRYGVELEFTHASLAGRTTRYVLGNRINNCIISSNSKEFYSYQFNLKDRASILMQQQRQGHTEITPDTTFNQWSNFLTEVMTKYHASTHDRLPTDTDNGRELSGFKIEHDPGIVYNGLRFKGMQSNIENNEYSSESDTVNELGERIYNKDYILYESRRESRLTMWKNGPYQIDPKIVTMTSGDASIDVVLVKDVMDLFENISVQTELVTPILVDEPFKIGGVYYPYGVIALENMISHMKSHSNVIFVHNDGLHIHLSKNLNDGEFTTAETIGLIKLFWMFEPLFLAAEPTYRGKNAANGYRSLQSIFSYEDMLKSTDKYILDVLTGSHIDVIRDSRYVSLNIMNLLPDKIGTVEYRIGHGTFDGKSIQLHTHLLQVLFQFNIALIKASQEGNYHDHLLKKLYALNSMPEYVHNTGYLRGFNIFDHMNISDRTEMILDLAKCFASSTGAVKGITMLLDYIELYHTYCETSPQGSRPTGFPGFYMNDIEPIKPKWEEWLESIEPIETIKFHYFETPDEIGMDGEACSDENVLYNHGAPLITSYESRIPEDVSHEYFDIPGDYDEDSQNSGKIQTELINRKVYGPIRTRRPKKRIRVKGGKRTRRPKGEKRTRRTKPRTQHAGFVIAPKDVSLNTVKPDLKPDPKDVSLNIVKPDLKPDPKDASLNIVKPDLKPVPKHVEAKHLKPFHTVFNMNRYLDLYDMHEDVHGMIGYSMLISYPCKFTDMSNVNIRLSSVASRLIDRKIITTHQLRTLVKFKYIDSFLYLEEPNCFDELITIMGMTPELFTQIKTVYQQVETEKYPDENIALNLRKYLKTGENPIISHYKN